MFITSVQVFSLFWHLIVGLLSYYYFDSPAQSASLLLVYTVSLILYPIITKKDILSPQNISAYSVLLYFTLPLFLFQRGRYLDYIELGEIISLILECLCIYFFVLELLLFKTRKISISKIKLKFSTVVSVGMMLLLLKGLIVGTGLQTGYVSEESGGPLKLLLYPVNVSILAYHCLLFGWLFSNDVSKKQTLLLLTIVAVFMFYAVSFGSKSAMFFNLLPYIYFKYLKERKLKLLKLLFIGVLMLSYFPVALYIKHGNYSQTNFVAVVKGGVEILSSDDVDILSLVVGRTNMIEPLYRIYTNRGDREKVLENYPLDNTYFPNFFTSFIPKAIFSSRVDANPGRYFGYFYGWESRLDRAYVSTSMVGEAKMNFSKYYHLVFLMIAMLNGLFYIVITRAKSFQLLSVYYYFLVYVLLTGFESYFVIRYVIFIKAAIIMLVFFKAVEKINRYRAVNA